MWQSMVILWRATSNKSVHWVSFECNECISLLYKHIYWLVWYCSQVSGEDQPWRWQEILCQTGSEQEEWEGGAEDGDGHQPACQQFHLVLDGVWMEDWGPVVMKKKISRSLWLHLKCKSCLKKIICNLLEEINKLDLHCSLGRMLSVTKC